MTTKKFHIFSFSSPINQPNHQDAVPQKSRLQDFTDMCDKLTHETANSETSSISNQISNSHLNNMGYNNSQNNSTSNQNSTSNNSTTKSSKRKVIQVQQQHKFVKISRSEKYGFGFVLRGQKVSKNSRNSGTNGEADNFRPSALVPSKQFLESLDEHGPANLAGLSAGDYLINVNNHDVTTWKHEDLVKLIRSQSTITLHMITVTKQKASPLIKTDKQGK